MMAEFWSLASALTSGAHSRTAREIVPRSGAVLLAPRECSSACAMPVRASLVFIGGSFLLPARQRRIPSSTCSEYGTRAPIARRSSTGRPHACEGRAATASSAVRRVDPPAPTDDEAQALGANDHA